MQDRIKELAIEAGLAEINSFSGQLVTEYGPCEDAILHFAQTIARECIATAFDAETDRVRGDLSGEAVAQAIRARFGIKER